MNYTTEPIHRYAKELHLYTGPAATHCTLAGAGGVCPLPMFLFSLEGKSAIFRFQGIHETEFYKCVKHKEAWNTLSTTHPDLNKQWVILQVWYSTLKIMSVYPFLSLQLTSYVVIICFLTHFHEVQVFNINDKRHYKIRDITAKQ